MATISLSSLQYMSRDELAQLLRNSASSATPSRPTALPASLAIVDVRDSDHVGGHLRGSTWVPSSTLDYRTADLVRTLADKELVVFHCVLSQQRGPSAALRYLQERERLLPDREIEGKVGGEGVEEQPKQTKQQRVVVLRGGFSEWQEKYGADEDLTEAWQKDIWEYGGY